MSILMKDTEQKNLTEDKNLSSLDKLFIKIAKRSIENQTFNPGDYRGEDGLMYCGKCHSKKQGYVNGYLFATACLCREIEEKKSDFYRKEKAISSSLDVNIMANEQYKDLSLRDLKITNFNLRNVEIAKRYVTKFEDLIEKNQGLIFYGDVGTGKTFTASCIAGELLHEGYSVAVTSFVKLLEFANGYRDTPEYKNLLKVSLLVIDDFGAERNTDFALEKIYGFVNDRYLAKLPIIITTNLTIEEMKNETDIRYKRVLDRLFEICYPVCFSGPSWRKHYAAVRYDEFDKEVLDENNVRL